MLLLLYTIFILYLTYKNRNNLLLYILENYDKLVRFYNFIILRDQIQFGFTINEFYIENISSSVFYRVSYNIGNKVYYIYLNKGLMYDYINGFRLNVGIPYKYDEIKSYNSSDDNIIMAYINKGKNEIDVTEFCKMISGPKGNFYKDCDINKFDKDIVIDDLKNWLINNDKCKKSELVTIDYDIYYMNCMGDEVKWDM
jgi:hypothetical protein